MLWKKFAVVGMSALMVVGLLGTAAVSFAQTDTPAESTEESTATTPSRRGRLSVNDEALAAALGITVEELDAAEDAARAAMIDQAVADGLLTEEEATALKEEGSLRRGARFGYDVDEFVAAALGITVEEFEAAELEAFRAVVAAAVEAGMITQDEADLLLARKAAKNYLDEDALNAAVRSAYADALAEAVAAGDITQAQADALLAQLETQTFSFGFGGHGGRGHHGGRGGWRGQGTETLPETTPDTTTDTSFDA